MSLVEDLMAEMAKMKDNTDQMKKDIENVSNVHVKTKV